MAISGLVLLMLILNRRQHSRMVEPDRLESKGKGSLVVDGSILIDSMGV